jgi:hypothetical protein
MKQRIALILHSIADRLIAPEEATQEGTDRNWKMAWVRAMGLKRKFQRQYEDLLVKNALLQSENKQLRDQIGGNHAS